MRNLHQRRSQVRSTLIISCFTRRDSHHANSDKENGNSFAGYQWTYFSSLPKGPLRSRAEQFLESVNWPALLDYAAEKRNGIKGTLFPDVGLGYNHMVRIIEFEDETKWAARLRMPPLANSGSTEESLKASMKCELSAIYLVRQSTSIPVPQVHAFEIDSNCSVRAPFMLMNCLEGNVGMDLGMDVPPEHKQGFLSSLAKIHVSNKNSKILP